MTSASSKQSTSLWIAIAAAILFSLARLPGLGNFPPVSVDEAYLANHAFNFYHTGSNRYSLYDDLFEPRVYDRRDATAGLIQIGYQAWLGPFMVGLSKSLVHARYSSITAGLIALILLILIGRLTGGVGGEWVALLVTACHPQFLLASSLVRAEIVLLMSSAGLLLYLLRAPDSFFLKYALAGLWGGLQLGIHQNAVPIFCGFLAFVFWQGSRRDRWTRCAWMSGFFLLGFGLILSLIELDKFIFSQKFLVFDLYKPPIMSWPWHPLEWIGKWLHLFIMGEPSFYLRAAPMGTWHRAHGLYWLEFLLPLFVLLKTRGKPTLVRYALGLVIFFLGLCGWIRKSEALYTVAVLIFSVPLMAASLNELRGSRAFKAMFVSLCILSLGTLSLFYVFRKQYKPSYVPFDHFVAEVRAQSQPTDRIAGLATLWFAWPEEKFRDVSALVGSRWLSEGNVDFSTWLGRWQPTILVVEPSWRAMLTKNAPVDLTISKALGKPVQSLGFIDLGPAQGGEMEILRIEWDNAERVSGKAREVGQLVH